MCFCSIVISARENSTVFLDSREKRRRTSPTLLKQQIPDKPTWLLSSGCSRFVRLCSFDFLYPVRRTRHTEAPIPGVDLQTGSEWIVGVSRLRWKSVKWNLCPRRDPFPRCNVKNGAFTALSTLAVIWRFAENFMNMVHLQRISLLAFPPLPLSLSSFLFFSNVSMISVRVHRC